MIFYTLLQKKKTSKCQSLGYIFSEIKKFLNLKFLAKNETDL